MATASATRTFEGFSVSRTTILSAAGTETFVPVGAGDIYGVREASLEVDIDSYDNTGDDSVLSTWYWFNFATVTVQAGYVPFDLLALLAGDTVVSSGTAPNDYYDVPLWSEGTLNQPPRPMMIRVPSKDAAGTSRTFDFILYRVQFEPFGFDGPTYKDGLLLNYSGRALISATNEAGTVLGERAVGRLVNRPPTI